MKVRFQDQKTPDGEDWLLVHYAPARRPVLGQGKWYLLLGGLSLVLVLVVLGLGGSVWCR